MSNVATIGSDARLLQFVLEHQDALRKAGLNIDIQPRQQAPEIDLKAWVEKHWDRNERIGAGLSPNRKSRLKATGGAFDNRVARRRAKNRTAKAARARNRR